MVNKKFPSASNLEFFKLIYLYFHFYICYYIFVIIIYYYLYIYIFEIIEMSEFQKGDYSIVTLESHEKLKLTIGRTSVDSETSQSTLKDDKTYSRNNLEKTRNRTISTQQFESDNDKGLSKFMVKSTENSDSDLLSYNDSLISSANTDFFYHKILKAIVI